MTDMTMTRFPWLFVMLAGLVACDDRAGNAPVGNAGPAVELGETLRPDDAAVGENSSSVTRITATEGDVLSSAHPTLLALSRDEARWLQRHGYPTASEMERLRSFDVEQLETALRNRKDVRAGALLGHRLLLDGDVAGASSAFSAAAAFGSLYARQQMALVNTMDLTGLPMDRLGEADQASLGVMVAQLEMARLLGDHRAKAYIDRYASTFDWKLYGRNVMNQTAEFMRQYGEFARAVGRRPAGPDPRPNAELWSSLGSDPNAAVTVYDREPGGF